MKLGKKIFKTDLSRIFISNELNAIEGTKKINIIIFSCILLFSMIGLGHSIGGIITLKKRMSNPFSNWIKVPVNHKMKNNALKFESALKNDSIKEKYGIEDVTGYEKDNLFFFNREMKNQFPYKCRSILKDETLLKKILEPSNIISSNYKTNNTDVFNDDCWIIVTEKLMRELSYSKLSEINYLPLSVSAFSHDLTHFVKVAYIVKELPDLCDVVLPVYLHQCFTNPARDTKYIDIMSSNRIEFLLSKKNALDSISKYIESNLGKIDDIEKEEMHMNNSKYTKLSFYLEDEFSFESRNNVIDSIVDSFNWINRYDDFSCTGEVFELLNPNYLSITMNDLSKVRELQKFAESSEYLIEISMNQVENKENFSLVTKLTWIISSLLFLLSLSAIVIFIYNIINNHLDKIAPNLGTLKAFGLSNKELVKFYMITILIFFIKSIGLTTVFIMIYLILMKIFNGDFVIFHWLILISIIVIAIFTLIISKFMLNRKLLNTPGDLIYQRT